MKLGEFIDLRKKIEVIRREFVLDKSDKINEKINNIANILGDITPFEYIAEQSYFNGLQIFEDFSNFDEKLNLLKKYLGEEYEAPTEFYDFVNKQKEKLLRKNINGYEVLYKFDMADSTNPYKEYISQYYNTELEEIIELESIKLIHKKIEYENTNRNMSFPMILARIMSDEELDEFKQDGIVESISYDGERVWESSNIGNYDYYTFMCMNNREQVLLNASSVIPYLQEYNNFEDEINEKNLNLVFFKSNNIKEDMVYKGKYNGFVMVDEYDGPDIYGIDKSVEVAVPYYSNKNFEIVMSCKTSREKIDKDFANAVNELNLLNYDDNKVEKSVMYNDFINWLDEKKINDIGNDSFDEEFYSYYERKMYEKKENKYFYDNLGIKSEDIGEELNSCINLCKNRFGLDYKTMIFAEGGAFQKLTNWLYIEPCYDDYEYDQSDFFDKEGEIITKE